MELATSLNDINAFAAAGLSSDHEVRDPKEGIDKLQRGVFLRFALIPHASFSSLAGESRIGAIFQLLLMIVTLRRRSPWAMDYNIRNAIRSGAPPEQAF